MNCNAWVVLQHPAVKMTPMFSTLLSTLDQEMHPCLCSEEGGLTQQSDANCLLLNPCLFFGTDFCFISLLSQNHHM